MSDISKNIKNTIAQQLEIKEGRVIGSARIIDDLGADSLDIIELLSILEEKFDIQIPDEDSNRITTVDYLISYIEEKKTKE
jgi:acyl carrier protein